MEPPQNAYPRVYNFSTAALILLGIFATRVIYLHLELFDIHYDEAQYWSWSKALDWGYVTKPPFIAWMIAATTEICGDTVICIRISAPILHLVTAFLVYQIGKELYGNKVGFWSSILYMTLPSVTGFSYYLTTDSPLLLFWTLALYSFILSYRTNKWYWWLLCGIACGCGMLSKYNMILFLPSALLFAYITRTQYQHFKNMRFWLSIGIALTIFMPNILWNVAHDYAGFYRLLLEGSDSDHVYHPKQTAKYLLGQFSILGPVLFFIVIWAITRLAKHSLSESEKLLLSFILPIIVTFFVLSFLTEVNARWATPYIVPSVILATAFLFKYQGKLWLGITIATHIAVALIFYHFPLISDRIEVAGHRFYRMTQYNEIINPTKIFQNNHPKAVIISDERKYLAVLTYGLRSPENQPKPVIRWNKKGRISDQFRLMRRLEDFQGKDVDYIIVTKPHKMQKFSPHFEAISSYKTFSNNAGEFMVMHAHHFKGY